MSLNVQPFRGLRYTAATPAELARVVSPPYDVINPEQQEALHAAHPQNVIRLILDPIRPTDTEQNNRYTRAAATLAAWRRNGVLVQDLAPAIYLYRHVFQHGGRYYFRYGLVARVRLAEPGQRRIVPHERTIAGPKADRLRLLQTTRANLCPIFLCYSTKEPRCAALHQAIVRWCQAAAPTAAVTFEGVEHAIWRVDDAARIAEIGGALDAAPLLIADGHHRYESACAYRDEQRQLYGVPSGGEAPWDYVMAYVTALDVEGMLILPIHRLVRGVVHDRALASLASLFQTQPCADQAAMAQALAVPDGIRFGLYGGGRYLCLVPRPGVRLADLTDPSAPAPWRQLAVTILHQVVLRRWGVSEEAVTYTADATEVTRAVNSGAANMAVFVQPTPAHEVQTIALSGERMPPKSTYFYPKLLTGLVINPLE